MPPIYPSGSPAYSVICIVYIVLISTARYYIYTGNILLHYGASSFLVRISRGGTRKAHLTRPCWIPTPFFTAKPYGPIAVHFYRYRRVIPLFSGPRSGPFVSPFSTPEGAWQVLVVPGGSLDLVATSPGEVMLISPLASRDLTFHRSKFSFPKTLRTRVRFYVWLWKE